jgi:Trk K+ transport system NAD-binding subunit
VAVARAGYSYYDPDADFRLFPGDRLVLLGNGESLEQARRILKERVNTERMEEATFRMKEVLIRDDSSWSGRRLSELDLRRSQADRLINILCIQPEKRIKHDCSQQHTRCQ